MSLFSTLAQFYKRLITKKLRSYSSIDTSQLLKLPRFKFGFNPKQTFEELTQALDMPTVPILGYGSLLNEESASLSLKPTTIKERRCVKAKGLKRIFEKDIGKNHSHNPWILDEEKSHPTARGSLNIKYTQNEYDEINGVVYHLDEEDFLSVCKREEGYDLIPIEVTIWNDVNKNFSSELIAYVFSASNENYLSNHITPRPSYFFLCREAAKKLGPEFYTMWQETTYLADGTTTIKKWDSTEHTL